MAPSPTVVAQGPLAHLSGAGFFPCAICFKSFLTAKQLQHHHQAFHTEKAFVCEICGKAFRFRSNLAEHRSVHTALKPYVCKFCGKSSRLKGNLTKHILKHHKKEQNEHIGTDDIIIKKGKKSVKDPAAVDFLEKSMIVLQPSSNDALLPKDEPDDPERSFLVSFGLDAGSMDLRTAADAHGQLPDSPDHGAYENGETTNGHADFIDNELSSASPLPQNTTVGGATSLAALLLTQVATPPSHNNNKTQCPECGKHFRKGSNLQMHMTVSHGHPPPGSTASSDERTSECGASTGGGDNNADLVPIQQELKQMKVMIGELRNVGTNNKVEQLLSGLDTRVGRLEKQVEMALNSIYTLVQLQTGINSSVTRFREDACEQLKSVRALLSEPSG